MGSHLRANDDGFFKSLLQISALLEATESQLGGAPFDSKSRTAAEQNKTLRPPCVGVATVSVSYKTLKSKIQNPKSEPAKPGDVTRRTPGLHLAAYNYQRACWASTSNYDAQQKAALVANLRDRRFVQLPSSHAQIRLASGAGEGWVHSKQQLTVTG
jgi:hypothetical protein